MKIHAPAKKYRFMIGTTSRVPGATGWHYLILDIDNPKFKPGTRGLHGPGVIYQRTKSGWHIFTVVRMRLKAMCKRAVLLGADHTWARLALRRGWAFLADKSLVEIPWPVERKIIGWKPSVMHKNTYAKAAPGKKSPKQNKTRS